jgi:hypothetical protein
MKITRLRGWQVAVQKQLHAGNDDEWVLVFTETFPPTGDELRYEMNRETRDAVVRGLTDGIVLAGGDLPKV